MLDKINAIGDRTSACESSLNLLKSMSFPSDGGKGSENGPNMLEMLENLIDQLRKEM